MDNEMENEVTELLEVLYNTVADAWSVPLGKDKCMINRESVLNLLDEIKAQLPIELSEAKRLLAARDEFVSNAKREAETIRKAAEDQARRLVEEQEITRIARAHANEIVAGSETKSRELVRAANEYVDDALRRTEEAVAAALNEIRQSRSRFRSLAGARPAAGNLRPDETDALSEE
ncbi:MAG: hypothetical protein LBL15_07355 [Oscillospiraceae bacterium]|jgi:cell division septum initiation protein DivIVA|nr:hypothetical protein [Oscillospiraceae bacterium]